MDLPEDSPLRDPIQTIQTSGQKAATIVQDLLTLSRRGVSIKEVLDFNEIVSNFMDSPECDKIREFYPKITLESDLASDLFNVVGSPFHLSKTVMNLVSNAAEAISDMGVVSLTTRNQYIDRSISGYELVPEGEYVVFKVSDSGSGISPDDLHRIFEPFYTKKTMGRSGTGLGMAVVWGTIKDLDGYIDVKSTIGEGTTFSLYFPASRQAVEPKKIAIPIEKYMGDEKILVVDDVEEQRDIASAMLGKLGYSVAAVASGEEAIKYVGTMPVDLVVLDMVMAPGIDGLETYREIVATYPHQRAVIASGFSETDRVKAAQRMGAGRYIRKPYSIEKIGLAVRAELDR